MHYMRNLLPLAALLFLQYTGRAQKFVYDRNPVHIGIVPRVTVADPAEDNYDVKYVKFNLVLGNLSTDLSGDVTTNAVTTVPSFTSYVFELDTLLTIDSMTCLAKFTGMAKPIPIDPPLLEKIAVLIPIRLPRVSINAPPEFPGLIAASV